MKELSEHILDIVQNSTAAGATHIGITLTEDEQHLLTVVIEDNGRGMEPEMLNTVTDPFTTSRTTRMVGLGLPLYRMSAEQTGGGLSIASTPGVGTTVTARLHTDHLDCPPLGDLPRTVALLVQGSPHIDFSYLHTNPKGCAELNTAELRETLGEEISLAAPEIFLWICDYLKEQESQLEGADV